MSTVAARLAGIEQRIAQACERSGRQRSDVRLVAVSKRKTAAEIRDAYALGQRDFGENYVQELNEKYQQLSDLPDIRWHLLGHLQRNKVKLVVSIISTIHTVDSIKLAGALDEKAASQGRVIDAFVQVNLAAEAQKSGCAPGELPELLTAMQSMQHLRVVGLMLIPPNSETAEQSRPWFSRLRQLAVAHQLTRLSMGMSDDFEVAIEEGSTDVRIGTAIFGERELAQPDATTTQNAASSDVKVGSSEASSDRNESEHPNSGMRHGQAQ